MARDGGLDNEPCNNRKQLQEKGQPRQLITLSTASFPASFWQTNKLKQFTFEIKLHLVLKGSLSDNNKKA